MSAFIPTTHAFLPPRVPQTATSLLGPGARLLTRRRAVIHTRFAPRAQGALVLTEENVNIALQEAKVKLGSVFGNNVENRDVGITGDVELAAIDGPVVVLRLKGRFWHKRADVLARVAAYLCERIPEVCDIEVEDVRQLEDSEEESVRLI